MMNQFRVASVVDQAVDFLRDQILRGRWSGLMPGRHELAVELGINHKTVETALKELERQGLLEAGGSGRRRRIRPLAGKTGLAPLRIAILAWMSGDWSLNYLVEMKHRLIEAGFTAFYTEPCLSDLGMEVPRIANLVKRTRADAWIVVGGSREVLEWFATLGLPVFALFGRRKGLRMAGGGPHKPPAYAEATRRLLALGHQRIVLLTHALRRLPGPGSSERAFLAELEAAGIVPGDYHLPDWSEHADGFHQRLESLFQLTPPTALILDTAPLFAAAQQFVARRGLRVPEDVSLVCTDEPSDLIWQLPPVSHIRWDSRPLVRRVVKWAANVSRGRQDIRQTLVRSEFVPAGTIGPAPGTGRLQNP